ncbi:aminotransferase class V-fold PLP-dependent enzyme [Pigmentibacter sp. JX0631]|uniref:cysteine desulfurase family protein n=1 Tax=Pigmentibacter sp. JX0631 TaxID=2976982 RepID=UPI0024692B1F|nr:aminotransferase class V-fold PLP-dependent enzyme [Pigmentibacter sp. JX0631]WGL59334.1 aminotransferase class V-fold PLP-dependent enzyme [Pigmentibacter sp. JX0631]
MLKNKFIKNFILPSQLYNTSKKNVPNIKFGGIELPKKTIYLDFAASTPLDRRVLNEMTPWMLGYFANAANRTHPMGEITDHAIAEARIKISSIFKVDYDDVIFTSSATESNNLFLRGLISSPFRKKNKILYSPTEHSSIIATIKDLSEKFDDKIILKELPIDNEGQIVLAEAEKLIDSSTLCVCVMDVNNETGILQKNISHLKNLCDKVNTILHIDMAQGFARCKTEDLFLNFDTATISSSKIYGPKGAAALIIKKRKPKIKLEPQLTGGGHEFLLRSSTPNTAAIIGFAKACELQKIEASERFTYYEKLENAFKNEISKYLQPIFYGQDSNKVKGILTLCISGVNAMKLLEETRSVCASVGSACKTLQATSSHVLLAMGVPLENALSSFRISFGLTNSESEVREAAKRLAKTAIKLKKESATLKQ